VTGRNEELWTATGCSELNQGGTTELLKPPSLGVGMEALCFQAAEKALPRRSRSFEPLNVPHGYAEEFSLPAASQEELFEQLA